MVSEEAKNKVGSLLFEMITIAMRDRGIKMDFSSWEKVDGQVKDNYMSYVERIVAEIDPPLYVSDKDKAKQVV